jgi:hypothetical protein
MPDLHLLRDLGDHVRPPDLDLLRETARRRNRRAAAVTVTACAAAVVVVIAGGAQVTGDRDRSAPRPASRPTPTQTTTPAPTDAHRLPLPKRYGDSAALDEGRYTVRLRNLPRELDQGGVLLAFDMDVPQGWKVTKPMIRTPSPIRPEFTPTKGTGGLGRLSVQHVTDGVVVEENPCHGSGYQRPPTTIRGIAATIAGLPRVDVSTPTTTTLGGVDALGLTITVRPDDNPDRCHDDAYKLYTGGDLGASLFETVWADQPGDMVRLWIVQVADKRFIFTAETPPDATQADHETLTRMVDSITFHPRLRGRGS